MTQQTLPSAVHAARQERVRQAFFRGSDLHLGNPRYLNSVRTLLTELLTSDVGSGDLTVESLQLADRQATARILAKEAGVIAGVAELSWFLRQDELGVAIHKQDGESIAAGELILEIRGPRNKLLAHERTCLNCLQRLSGIATATRQFQNLVHRENRQTHVIGTRKTPWGLMDKRALHLGGGGTHRLGLWDAILVKNNHLALLADSEEEAVRIAVERAWRGRESAAFIEVEVRSQESALAAAQEFRSVQESCDGKECPCVLLLDNMAPQKIPAVMDELRGRDLLEHVLTEASGNISEANILEYADSGVDVISIGAVTHSVRALDICLRF